MAPIETNGCKMGEGGDGGGWAAREDGTLGGGEIEREPTEEGGGWGRDGGREKSESRGVRVVGEESRAGEEDVPC